MPITQTALTGSVFCTMAFSVERYLTVCRPFYVTSNHWPAKRYIIPILLFSLAYNFPRFFELRTKVMCNDYSEDASKYQNQNDTAFLEPNRTQLEEEGSTSQTSETIEAVHVYNQTDPTDNYYNCTEDINTIVQIELTELRMDKYYYSIYTVGLTIIFMGIVPFTLLILLGTLTLKRLIVYAREDVNIVPLTLQTQRDSVSPYATVSTNVPTIQSLDVLEPTDNEDVSHRNSNPFTIKKRLKTNEIRLAKVSLIISLIFIVSHSIRWIPNIYELIQRMQDKVDVSWPDWIELFTQFSHLLTVFNSSVNFYIYYFTRYQITSINCFTHCKRLDDKISNARTTNNR